MDSSTVLTRTVTIGTTVKGQEWYQADDVAARYEDKRFSGGGKLIDRREKTAVLEALGPLEGKRILEIACGTGRFTVLLADQGAEVVGLDISEPMLQRGRRKADGDGAPEFIRGDASRLPFPDDHFDAVVAMRFFHLTENPHAFLAEMRRVSRRQIVFDTFNRASTRSIYNWALPMGSRLYSRGDVDALLRSQDLELVDVQDDFVLPFGFYRILPGVVARSIYRADRLGLRLPLVRGLASVSTWNTRIR